ncbi:STAS domain-containing protein [Streptomyces sp. NPDC048361]|uniref:STAS domain-containing protein n=1 Tax=Streptomyces sp. NPDC048361 TaxID=3154720 RepID=UPI003449F0E3
MSTQLNITTTASSAGPIMALTGELDHDTVLQVHQALLALELHTGQQLTVDLTHLTFCDSSGISVLLAARNRAIRDSALFALAAVPAGTVRMFAIVGLDRVLPVFPTADQAVATWTRTDDPS